jgi:predicted DNA-binding transcriptional regulator AlpA
MCGDYREPASRRRKNMNDFGERLAFTIPQLTSASGISRTSVYREIQAGRLEIRKIGRRTVVLAEDARRWLASLPR